MLYSSISSVVRFFLLLLFLESFYPREVSFLTIPSSNIQLSAPPQKCPSGRFYDEASQTFEGNKPPRRPPKTRRTLELYVHEYAHKLPAFEDPPFSRVSPVSGDSSSSEKAVEQGTQFIKWPVKRYQRSRKTSFQRVSGIRFNRP